MNKLSAFADEISDDLNVQIKELKANGVDNIELRGVFKKNVLALTEDELKQVKQAASDNGLGFSAVGSPLGKFPLDGDFGKQMDDVRRGLDYAAILEAPYIRMFSFHIPKGDDPATHRAQVMDWLGKMVEEAEKTDVILAHENEKGIYGDTGARCLDLFQTIQSDSFACVFDFANFVQCGEHPLADCWPVLKDHLTYFHIKDAMLDGGKVVPPGHGDGDMEVILRDAFAAGFDNFLTLEPHLSVAEANYGKTTPDLFKTAADALKDVLSRAQ